MKIKDNVKIIVSEPWNFASSEGDNIFSAKIYDKAKSSLGEVYLLKVKIPFIIDNLLIKWIVISKRDKHNSVNVYNICDKDIASFKNIDTIKNRLKFIIIGSVE